MLGNLLKGKTGTPLPGKHLFMQNCACLGGKEDVEGGGETTSLHYPLIRQIFFGDHYVPGTSLGAGGTAVNKTGPNPSPLGGFF